MSRLSLTAAWSLRVSEAMRKMSAGFHCSAGAVEGLRSYGNLYVPVSRCSSSVLNRLTMHVRCCSRNWETSAASSSVSDRPSAALLTMLPRLLFSSGILARGAGSRTALAMAAAAAAPSMLDRPETREESTPCVRKNASLRPTAEVYCVRSSAFLASSGSAVSTFRTMSLRGPRRKSGTGRESSGVEGRLGDATARVARLTRATRRAPASLAREARRARPRRDADARDASTAGAAMDAARDIAAYA